LLSDIENNLSVVIGNIDKALQHQEQNVKTLGNDENGVKQKVKEFRNDINKRLCDDLLEGMSDEGWN
jgi:chaperonin cofactor prefoldin